MALLERMHSSACMSDYRLDRLIDGTLALEEGPEAAKDAHEHIAECAQCRDRHGALTAFAERALADLVPLAALMDTAGSPADPREHKGPRLAVLPGGAGASAAKGAAGIEDAKHVGRHRGEHGPRTWRERWGLSTLSRFAGPMVPAALAAAAVALVLLPERETGVSDGDNEPAVMVEALEVTTPKGGGDLALGLIVARQGHMHEAASGAIVYPGDIVQFTYDVDRDGYLAILSRDGGGIASIYFDDEAGRAAAVAGGRDVPVPVSIELDEVVGRERIYAVFCDRPVSVLAWRDALASGSSDGFADRVPASCTLTTMELDKRRSEP